MNNIIAMKITNCINDLNSVENDNFFIKSSVFMEELRQVSSFEIWHNEEHYLIGLKNIFHFNQIWMFVCDHNFLF